MRTSTPGAGSIGKRTLVEQVEARGLAAPSPRTSAPSEPAASSPPVAGELGARVDELAVSCESAAALRQVVAIEPGLAGAIERHLATEEDANGLNTRMAAAFPPAREPSHEACPQSEASATTSGDLTSTAGKAEKQPAAPPPALPVERAGSKVLAKGVMRWTLKATDPRTAAVRADFKPDPAQVEAKNVSYVQTVISKVGRGMAYGGGTPDNPAKRRSSYQPFEEQGSKKRADHFPGSESDPFYGAEWDASAKRWKQERASWRLGSATQGEASKSASMTDAPSAPESRRGHGDTSSQFETVPVVLETREPLGALAWGYAIPDRADAALELLGATEDDCSDAPSTDWGKTLDQFYVGKFATVLDEFEVGQAELAAAHEAQLDTIAAKLKADSTLKAQLGGACDLTEQEPDALSYQRAEKARDYLVGKGIAAARLEIQSYGADWARVEEARDAEAGKNRRVQVWLHK
jgi:outer membrane protein OmpA-like peptidoglycan-associated protein